MSAADVVHGRVDKRILQDAIVLVGTTAPGLFDLRTTPVQKQYAGVEIHANLIAGILDQNIKQRPAYVDGVELIQLLLLGCFLTLTLPLMSPIWVALTTLIISAFLVADQVNFMKNRSLGFDKEGLVVLDLRGINHERIQKTFESVKSGHLMFELV